MNYYQHHIGDFIRDTSRLSDAQCMAYLRLIWVYYETEEPLDSDADALAFKIGANASDVHQILKHFFFEHDGRWHNSRCDREILAYREKSKKAKESATARWDNAKAMRTHTDRKANAKVFDANQEPRTNNQEPITTKKKKNTLSDSYSPEFEEAWSAYPARPNNNKSVAYKAWKARISAGTDPQEIIAGVKRYAAYCKTSISSSQYVKQAATFFGPDEHYLLDWSAGQPTRTSKMNDMGLEMTAEEFTRSYEDQGFKVARP